MNYSTVAIDFFTRRILQTVQALPGKVYLGNEAVKPSANEAMIRARFRSLVAKKFDEAPGSTYVMMDVQKAHIF